MRELNLVYKDKSQINYTINNYPDGQRDIVVHIDIPFISADSIIIKSRLNNAEDLLMIVATTKALNNLGVKKIHLFVPMFLGQRSDRQFVNGGVHYLKDVVCPIINSLRFKSVTVIDPHSDVLEACINNFKKQDNKLLVRFALADLYKPNTPDNFILVSPDSGASKKIYKLAEQIGYNGDIIICSKDRDVDGKLTKCIVPKFDYKKDVIIVDDIFDYGKTFTNILEEINKNTCDLISPIGKKYLIVTHSIQEEGLIRASKLFDGIYTTNSYKDHNINNVKIFNVF